MSTSTPQTLSLTFSASDANRVQAAATGLGFETSEAMLQALLISQVSSWEQQNHLQTYADSYTPIAPS